jgi:hypothetical protein
MTDGSRTVNPTFIRVFCPLSPTDPENALHDRTDGGDDLSLMDRKLAAILTADVVG